MDSSATARPCPVSTAGWRPCATSRSSARVAPISWRAWWRRATVSVSELSRRSSSASSRDSAMSLCCAPSCRLRSNLLRSVCPASMTRVRERCSSSRWAFSSACSWAFSSAMPAAAPTAASRSGSSFSAGSCSRAAMCLPSRSIVVVARLARCRQRHQPALHVRPAVELGQPVHELEGGVAQCTGQGVAQVGRSRVGAQVHEQVGHRGAGQARVEEAEQERRRRQADREQGRQAGCLEAVLPEHGHEEQERRHGEREGERVHQQGQGSPQGVVVGPSADDDEHDPGQRQGGEQAELDPEHRLARHRVRP